jgi:hypothetical protein
VIGNVLFFFFGLCLYLVVTTLLETLVVGLLISWLSSGLTFEQLLDRTRDIGGEL